MRNKWQTSISGLSLSKDKSVSTYKELLKKFKKMLSCNGHIDNETDTLCLQGDHRDKVMEYLTGLGISKDLIITSGTA